MVFELEHLNESPPILLIQSFSRVDNGNLVLRARILQS